MLHTSQSATQEIVHKAVPDLHARVVPATANAFLSQSLYSFQNPLPQKTLPDPPGPGQAGAAGRPLCLQGPLG